MAKGASKRTNQRRRRTTAAPGAAARMHARRLRTLGLLSVIALGALTTIGGCKSDDTSFDPRFIDQLERERAAETPTPPLRTFPTTLEATPTVRRGSTTLPANLPTTGQTILMDQGIRLPLREVLQRAVANSSEVKVAGYDPAINAARVIEAEANFDPAFFDNLRYDRSNSPIPGLGASDPNNLNTLLLQNATKADVVTNEFGLKQNLLSGGQASLSYLMSRNYITSTGSTNPNKFYENELRLNLTQPLLRQFGTQINTARIRIARNDRQISVLDFRKTLEDNLSNLEQDYWNQYEAERELQIQEELLRQTIETYSVIYNRWKNKLDASVVPTRQAEAAVKARQATLAQAKQRILDLSSDMKRRMNDPDFAVAGEAVLLTETPPLLDPIDFDVKQQIDTAMVNRFELGQQRLRIDSTAIAQEVAKNAELPQLDLILNVGFLGVGADENQAASQQAEFGQLNGSAGLNFQWPLGNREAIAVYRRSQLQRLQAIEQYRNLVAQVSLDVVTSLHEINSTWQQAILRQQARLAFTEQLRQIQIREDNIEKLTPEFVNVKLQAQSDLAQAARDEATAIAAYNIAIQRLERSKGTLLRYNNVLIDEARLRHPER